MPDSACCLPLLPLWSSPANMGRRWIVAQGHGKQERLRSFLHYRIPLIAQIYLVEAASTQPASPCGF